MDGLCTQLIHRYFLISFAKFIESHVHKLGFNCKLLINLHRILIPKANNIGIYELKLTYVIQPVKRLFE